MVLIPHRLGIDIGNVIVDGSTNDASDTSFFSNNFLLTSAVPHAFSSIAELVNRFGPNHVYLISKCGTNIQEKTLAWLSHHQFFERTGMNPQHYRFCRRRPEKAGICQGLGITHFVDDRAEILVSMQGVVTHRYVFNPKESELRRYAHLLSGEQIVRSWPELLPLILSTIP